MTPAETVAVWTWDIVAAKASRTRTVAVLTGGAFSTVESKEAEAVEVNEVSRVDG